MIKSEALLYLVIAIGFIIFALVMLFKKKKSPAEHYDDMVKEAVQNAEQDAVKQAAQNIVSSGVANYARGIAEEVARQAVMDVIKSTNVTDPVVIESMRGMSGEAVTANTAAAIQKATEEATNNLITALASSLDAAKKAAADASTTEVQKNLAIITAQAINLAQQDAQKQAAAAIGDQPVADQPMNKVGIDATPECHQVCTSVCEAAKGL